MLTFDQILNSYKLTFNKTYNHKTAKRLYSLVTHLEQENLLSRELLELILHDGYPRDDSGTVLHYVAPTDKPFSAEQKMELKETLKQAATAILAQGDIAIDECIEALNYLHHELGDIEPELLTWLFSLKSDHGDLAHAYHHLIDAGYEKDWIRETLTNNATQALELTAACRCLKELQINDEESFNLYFELFKNPLVLTTCNRSPYRFNGHFAKELAALLTITSYDERVQQAYELFNKHYCLPDAQASFDSQLLWASQSSQQSSEFDEHAYDVDRLNEEQAQSITPASSYQVEQSRRYVKSAVKRYFETLPLENKEQYTHFITELQKIKKPGGINALWPQLRYQAASSVNRHNDHRQYSSFSQLMSDVEAGKDADLSSLDFRDRIKTSKGYRAHCANQLLCAKTRGQKRAATAAFEECEQAHQYSTPS